MAATEILAVGSGAANSADVVIAAGSTLTVALKDATGPVADGRVQIFLKGDSGQYWNIGELSSSGTGALVIIGAGTYRFSRVAESPACGVFSG
jgi:hypothetical protein